EIIPLSERNGVSQVVFSPLAQGVLTGKYKKGQAHPAGSRATDPSSNMWMGPYLTDEVLGKVEQLEGVAKELGYSLSQLALAWVLRIPNIASALIGASRPEQIEENVKAADIKLDQETIDRIEAILTA